MRAAHGSYGNERDEDLVALCRRHHGAFHAKHAVARDMTEDTVSFVHSAVFDEEANRTLSSIR